MTTADHMPTGREQLAAELRRLRDLAGVSGRDLAPQVGISQSKVSRIESGATIPSLPEVTGWGKALGVSVETQERLVALTEAAYTEVHPWRAALQRRGHLQDDFQELETQSRLVRSFQPSLVPGLLQTADYARRVFTMFQVPYRDDDLAAALGARLHRQLALYESDRRFDFLITEGALRWRPGPRQLLLAQLDRVTSVSTLENVSIGLIPLNVEAVATMAHSFVIYQATSDNAYDEADQMVSVETIHANVTTRDPGDVDLYLNRWSRLAEMAIFGDEARRFLTALSAEIQAGAE